jgi:hypothetical protein
MSATMLDVLTKLKARNRLRTQLICGFGFLFLIGLYTFSHNVNPMLQGTNERFHIIGATTTAVGDLFVIYSFIGAGVPVAPNDTQISAGATYDYRSHYRRPRLNSRCRKVLAFGTPEKLAEKLAHLLITVGFDHALPTLSVELLCRRCGGRQAHNYASV